MGDLDEAIREHLELKRRRGADPAEVAREEQEALAPVTRSHPIVVPDDLERAGRQAAEPVRNGDHPPVPAHQDPASAAHDVEPLPPDDPGDATQEFHVVLGDADWLEDDEET